MLADTASLAVMVENIGQGSCQWKESMKRYVDVHVHIALTCIFLFINLIIVSIILGV